MWSKQGTSISGEVSNQSNFRYIPRKGSKCVPNPKCLLRGKNGVTDIVNIFTLDVLINRKTARSFRID